MQALVGLEGNVLLLLVQIREVMKTAMEFVKKMIVTIMMLAFRKQKERHVMMAIQIQKMIASKRMAVLVQVRQLKYQPMHVTVDRQA